MNCVLTVKARSQKRCRRELESKAFNPIRNKVIIETTGEDLDAVLKRGGSAANNYLRRLHNLAVKRQWIFNPIIPPGDWPKPEGRGKRRGITFEEHSKIVAAERNEERRNYYELLWLVGAAQTDASLLTSQNVNWQTRILSYKRQKTGEWAFLRIGSSLESLLKRLPAQGSLFPKIATLSANDRAAEFSRRCRGLGIEGVSLHSYRYAWAERAYQAGYQERYAKAALGHHKNPRTHSLLAAGTKHQGGNRFEAHEQIPQFATIAGTP